MSEYKETLEKYKGQRLLDIFEGMDYVELTFERGILYFQAEWTNYDRMLDIGEVGEE